MNNASADPVVKANMPDVSLYSAQYYRTEESMVYTMRQILNGVAHQIEVQLAHTELTNAQWFPLFKLHKCKVSTASELARECRLDAGAMTRMLDRLEAKDLCRRVRSASDRRVVNITLTEEGRAAAAEIPRALTQVENACLSGFSANEFEALKGFLRRILANGQALDRGHV
nr:MarR family transcriptional regulator [Rhodoferax sp.]